MANTSKPTAGKGLAFQRHFTKEGQTAFEMFEYDYRESIIRNPNGEVKFKLENVEVPTHWSQIATDILAQKYFRKAGVPQADGSLGRETSVKQVAHRMADCWRHWGSEHGYFATKKDAQVFYDELVYSILAQSAAPNSPQWFNTGLHNSYGIEGSAQGHYYVNPRTGALEKSKNAYERPQPHACFILSVSDDLVNEGGIMDLWVREARIFKYGSGVGTNYSNIRAEGEKLAGGGTSSGLMSFLKIGDRAAGAIKSGGTTRRAAKMVCLDLDHPEVPEFIDWKMEEEKKVAALIAGGYASDYEGEAYRTVSGQNSNNSVRIPNAFFRAVEENKDWNMTARTDGKVMKTMPARAMMDKIAEAAWRCADPGTQYDTTINEWHTCPEGGKIRASNPCVTADTFVTTDRGLERIGDLVSQSRGVKSLDGKMHWVENIFPTGHKDIYQLRTKSGYEIKLTANHQVWTVNRGDVPASELTKDDTVMLVRGEFGTTTAGSESMAQLMGLLLGDGCITKLNEHDAQGNRRRVAFLNMSREEEGVLNWANDAVNGLRLEMGEHNKRSAVQDAVATMRVSVGAPGILEAFERFVVLDEGSAGKRLRDLCFTLNRAEQAALLRGLFTADGCVANYGDKSQYVSLDSCALELLKQVQLLLLNFGIKGKIYQNRRAGKLVSSLPDGKGGMKDYAVQEMHSLRLSRNSRILFEEYIGFMPQSAKAAQLRTLNQTVSAYAESLTDKVASLNYLGTEDVFDLTEPETSHFVANGIAVHNCSEYMFLDNTACNLASLNLRRFFNEDKTEFDVEGFEYAVRLWTVVLEVSVLMAQFPSPEVAQLSYDYRTLGLGYANLGSMLMVSGIPYDSEEGRAIAGAITAIMNGVSYKTSAEMAAALGAFPRYAENKEHMMRVMRNHRLAAYDSAPDGYENLEIIPQGINAKYCPDNLLKAATRAWDDCVQMGEQYGYRNAQATVIAPTGTIGLVMDCDTTGIEPDFALVKFKKLAGGGYMKIVNQSVPAALRKLGYAADQIDAMVKYAKGHATFAGAPFINHESLTKKGFTADDLGKVEKAVESAFEIGFVFNHYTLGEDCMARLGFAPAQYQDMEFSLLEALGFDDDQIEACNDYVCGTMMMEGAPHLKAEHLPVFDTANKCGKHGERFIHAHGHIRMMSATQPFISGAISKTINLPNEATVAEIKDCYQLSWELGIKACALYRDGSKLSQPLSNKSDKKKKAVSSEQEAGSSETTTVQQPSNDRPATVQQPFNIADLSDTELLAEMNRRMQASTDTILKRQLSQIVERKSLPAKRRGYTIKAKVGGQPIFVRTGEYPDGTLGEIFVDMAKEGATMRSLLNSFAIAISVGLQYGVPLDEYVDKFTFTRFEPSGMVDHPNIKNATSVLDYIFRMLAYEYLGREDLVHVITPREGADSPELLAPARAVSNEQGAVSNGVSGLNPDAVTNLQQPSNNPPTTLQQPSNAFSGITGSKPLTLPRGNAAPALATAMSTNGNGGTNGHGANGHHHAGSLAEAKSDIKKLMGTSADAPACRQCGNITMRNGTCYMCPNCGTTTGCS